MFYSLRNKLEEQEIVSSDKNNQFLASIISMYPCLDIWVKVASDDELDVRVVYIQKNPGFTSTEPMVRANEEPKIWKQFQGTWDGIKRWFIGVLPELSQLHTTKRTGLHVLGGKQPYDGGGMIVQENADGTVGILGRFGVLTVTVDGISIPFQQLAWDFEGCAMEVTVTETGWSNVTVNERPTQNMTNSKRSEAVLTQTTPTATLSYQAGVGGYRRLAGLYGPGNTSDGSPGLPAYCGYSQGTNHGPPAVLSPTNLPDYNYGLAPGHAGIPSNLMDSYYGEVSHIISVPLVSDTGTVRTYQGSGSAAVGKWTRTHSSFVLTGNAYNGVDNPQGLATLTPHYVSGDWTITKREVAPNTYDWTWSFVSSDAYTVNFSKSFANNVFGEILYMATNGAGTTSPNDGPSQLEQARLNVLGSTLSGLDVQLDTVLPNAGFVINGNRIPQTLPFNTGNIPGLCLSGDASYGALTIEAS